MALAMPFIIVRITYLFLSVFQSSDPKWSDLTGWVVPFLLMGLLMEYAVVCIYISTGFIIPGRREEKNMLVATHGRQLEEQSA